MSKKSHTKADLIQFTGSENLFRHSLIGHIRYTDGVQYVAKMVGTYRLIDEVTFHQVEPAVAAEPFQHWKLEVWRPPECSRQSKIVIK